MKLSAEQLKAFDEQGYVFFPNCFSEEEIALLLKARWPARSDLRAECHSPSLAADTHS